MSVLTEHPTISFWVCHLHYSLQSPALYRVSPSFCVVLLLSVAELQSRIEKRPELYPQMNERLETLRAVWSGRFQIRIDSKLSWLC